MSCGQSACADDENDWYDFKKNYGITDVKWDVYSVEASVARKVGREQGFDGRTLKLLVQQELENRAMAQRHVAELEALLKAEALIRQLDKQ